MERDDIGHPSAIYAPLLKQLSDAEQNAVVTTDVGQHQMWSAQHMTLMHEILLLDGLDRLVSYDDEQLEC